MNLIKMKHVSLCSLSLLLAFFLFAGVHFMITIRSYYKKNRVSWKRVEETRRVIKCKKSPGCQARCDALLCLGFSQNDVFRFHSGRWYQSQSVSQYLCRAHSWNVMSLSAPSVCLPVSRAAGTIAPVSSRTWKDNV